MSFALIYSALKDREKDLFYHVVTNPILHQILKIEKEILQNELLNLKQAANESDAYFILQHHIIGAKLEELNSLLKLIDDLLVDYEKAQNRR